ncbi:peptidoglycan DD-metalloendopeptidase family protein [Angustibacter sp. McL0619]|uniref:M23 family metallopeptidase n=1 Tax=Angustibacter sp. McL0619 TaxID=3415676 RepID=UPI003CEC9968
MRLARTTRLTLATVLTALIASLVAPATSAQAGPADKKRHVDRSIASLQDDLEDTSSDLVAAYHRLQSIQKQLPSAQADLVQAQARLAAAQALDLEIGRQLTVARAQEAKADDDLSAATASTAETTDKIAGIARQAYQTGGIGELSVALAAESADDFAQRVVGMDTAMQMQGMALAQLDVDRAQIRAKQARLVAVRQQVALLKAKAEAGLARAATLEKAAEAAKARVESLIRSQAAVVRTIEVRKAAERRRLDALEAQARKLRAQLAAIARANLRRHGIGGGGFTSNGYLSTPVTGARISSEFGMRFHPILHYWRLHAGMDFAVPCGTPVHAAASGVVVSAGWGGGYGNRIIVSHGVVNRMGLATTYNHLSRILVHSGHVSRGQLIALSGTTGESTGCHLHFETYDNGTPVNPRRWL